MFFSFWQDNTGSIELRSAQPTCHHLPLLAAMPLVCLRLISPPRLHSLPFRFVFSGWVLMDYFPPLRLWQSLFLQWFLSSPPINKSLLHQALDSSMSHGSLSCPQWLGRSVRNGDNSLCWQHQAIDLPAPASSRCFSHVNTKTRSDTAVPASIGWDDRVECIERNITGQSGSPKPADTAVSLHHSIRVPWAMANSNLISLSLSRQFCKEFYWFFITFVKSEHMDFFHVIFWYGVLW